MSNIIKGLLPTGKAPSVLKAEIIELIGQNAPSKEEFENMDALPAGGLNGQVLTRVGGSSADWVNAPGTSVQAVTVEGRDKIRVHLTNGAVTDVPVSLNTQWSKEEQARVQGYWEVVSDTEPESSTYTLRDGTVLPVKWTRPISKIVPVFPQAPEWDDMNGRVMVPSLVGVDYQLNGRPLQTNQWVGVPGPRPGKAVVEAKAKAGYRLISSTRWEHDFPDPAAVETWTSDTFNRADTSVMSLGATDAANGGVSLDWGYKSPGDFPEAEKLMRENFRLQGRRLAFDLTSADVKAPGFRTVELHLEGAPENWGVEFDLLEYRVAHGATLTFGTLAANQRLDKSAVTFELYQRIPTDAMRIQVRYHDSEQGNDNTVVVMDNIPLGRISLRKYGSSVEVEAGGRRRSISLPGYVDRRTQLHKMRIANQFGPGQQQRPSWVIDNLKILKLGF